MDKMKAKMRLMKDAVLQLKDRGKRPLCQSEGEVLRFTLLGNIVAFVYKGDLLQVRTDAIVCCEHSSFTGNGRLVSAIISLGGEQYDKNRQQKVNNQKGEIRTCRGGTKLLCKYVMHAAAVTFDRWRHEESEEALKKLYDSVFKEADRKQLRSLALPLLGAGDSGFSADVCARILVTTLMLLSAECQWLPKEIHVVNNREDTTALIIRELSLQIPNIRHSDESLSTTPEGMGACVTGQPRDSYAENPEENGNSEDAGSSTNDAAEENSYEQIDQDEKEAFKEGSGIFATPGTFHAEELRRRYVPFDPNALERHSHRPLPQIPTLTSRMSKDLKM